MSITIILWIDLFKFYDELNHQIQLGSSIINALQYNQETGESERKDILIYYKFFD